MLKEVMESLSFDFKLILSAPTRIGELYSLNNFEGLSQVSRAQMASASAMTKSTFFLSIQVNH